MATSPTWWFQRRGSRRWGGQRWADVVPPGRAQTTLPPAESWPPGTGQEKPGATPFTHGAGLETDARAGGFVLGAAGLADCIRFHNPPSSTQILSDTSPTFQRHGSFYTMKSRKACNLYKRAESNSASINVPDAQLCSLLPDKPFHLATLQFPL